MILEVSPKKIFGIHVAIIFLLLCANIFGIVSRLYLGHDYVYGLVPLFDFNSERNIPTLFSSIMLIVCSALLCVIATNNKKIEASYIPWIGLSFIFLFLSIDEINSIHERLIIPTREALEVSALPYYAWVVPYSAALIIFVVAYSKFLLNLQRLTMRLFLVAGFIFVSGAIGFELLAGREAEAFREDDLLYSVYYTCEEFLEMFGIAIFLYALLTYIISRFESLRIIVIDNND